MLMLALDAERMLKVLLPPDPSRTHTITSDPVTNRIIVVGPPDILAKANDLVEKKLDVPDFPCALGPPGPPFRTYCIVPLAGDTANALVERLRAGPFKDSPTCRISAAGGSEVRVYATPGVHMEVEKVLREQSAR
jgi:hypothetical protein